MLDSINYEQGLYVLKAGEGYTALGFDVAYTRAQKAAEWLEIEGPDESLKGTLEGYASYCEIYEQVYQHYHITGERCPTELTPELIGLEGRRVEVIDCYGETRRFYVGKSTGHIPVHLEIARSDSTGGAAVMGTPFQSVKIIR